MKSRPKGRTSPSFNYPGPPIIDTNVAFRAASANRKLKHVPPSLPVEPVKGVDSTVNETPRTRTNSIGVRDEALGTLL